MFFLTKLAGALLKPLSLVIAALLLGLLLAALTRYRRTGLTVIALATLGLGAISLWPVANTLIAPLERQYPPVSALEQAPGAIVVLGGGGVDDPSLPLTAQLSATSLQRLIEGVRLWRQYPEALLVTSGALSRGRSQAAIAADLAIDLGVSADRVRRLPGARNTEEEAAAYARDIAAGERPRLEAPVVVSSASHLPRAIAYFRGEGLEPVPAPTAHRAHPRHFDRPTDFAPSADDLRTTEAAWHEYLGRLWAWLRGRR